MTSLALTHTEAEATTCRARGLPERLPRGKEAPTPAPQGWGLQRLPTPATAGLKPRQPCGSCFCSLCREQGSATFRPTTYVCK